MGKLHAFLWVNYMHFYGAKLNRESGKNAVELLAGSLKIIPTLIYFTVRQ
jgi:hypothetical protein